MVVSGRNKKSTLNLRLFEEEKKDVTVLADKYDVASSDLLIFALRKLNDDGLDPQELANFVVQRHNPKLAVFIKSKQKSAKTFEKKPAEPIEWQPMGEIRISEKPKGDQDLSAMDEKPGIDPPQKGTRKSKQDPKDVQERKKA